jgi:hypothetical protein
MAQIGIVIYIHDRDNKKVVDFSDYILGDTSGDSLKDFFSNISAI